MKASLDAAVAGFEPLFFGNLVVVLDGYFMHRMRATEGKDGNPLIEVRALCSSIMTNQGQGRLRQYDQDEACQVGPEVRVR